jgi:hypothetical protein
MLREKRISKKNRLKIPSRRLSQGKVMGEREAGLHDLGLKIGTFGQLDNSGPIASAPVSGYGEYTPVTVRNHTVPCNDAGLERDQSRN